MCNVNRESSGEGLVAGEREVKSAREGCVQGRNGKYQISS